MIAPPPPARRVRCAGPVLLLLAMPLGSPARGEETLPRGTIIERVTCRAVPDQAYALYLPADYTPSRHWPILYVLDARGRAPHAAAPFREGAAAWGWIVASSYGTRSDTDTEPSLRALRALFADTRERLALDERRVVLAGFSGMARLAVAVAANTGGAVAGVIGVGAGFPEGAPPARDLPFAWFGAAGDRDFNFSEMRSVEALLRSHGLPHRFRSFPGGHEWPPSEICREAVSWMEVRAARRGERSKDDPLLAALLRERMSAARALASAGKALEAFRAFRDLAEDFETLADVSEARRRADEMARSPEVRRALKEETRTLAAEAAEVRRAERALGQALGQTPLPPAGTVAGDLRVEHWKREASRSPGSARALMAERILAKIAVQTGYSLPQRFAAGRQTELEILVLEVATAVRPEEPSAWLALARARARAGRRGGALEALRAALARGAAPGAVASDSDLAPLLQNGAGRR